MRKRKTIDFSVPSVIMMITVILGMIWIFDSIYRLFRKQDIPAEYIDARDSETENLPFLELPDGYTAERKKEQEVHDGLLLQIDSAFSGKTEFINFQNKNACYHLKEESFQIQKSALLAMNALAEAYFQETGRTDILVYSTTESDSSENAFYSDILPDRSTGFCLDLAFLDENGMISKISPENAGWLKENAFRFGFIQSVPEAEYHFRYVGKLHAFLMKEQNLTLEQYLHALRNYSVSNPYSCFFENQEIKIYFVPAAAYGSTDIPVPKHQTFEISGNDSDGFIVWTTAEQKQ